MGLGTSQDKARSAFSWMVLTFLGAAISLFAGVNSDGEWQKFFLAIGSFFGLVWLMFFLAWRAYRKRS